MSATLHTNDPQRTVELDRAAGQRYVRSTDPRRKSAGLAGFLSLMPGLGQVYVGYYQRGFVHVLVAGSVFSMLVASDDTPGWESYFPLGLIFLIFFEIYNIIDAVRRATLYNLSLDGVEQIELPDDFSNVGVGGSYLGGAALVIFGLVALSHTAFGLPLEWLEAWWPLVPLLFGGHLIYRAYQDSQRKN
jgi:TM2 domain-containing membrane protein YozV